MRLTDLCAEAKTDGKSGECGLIRGDAVWIIERGSALKRGHPGASRRLPSSAGGYLSQRKNQVSVYIMSECIYYLYGAYIHPVLRSDY